MILVIRISGQVGISREEKETLYRIRIRRKYAATLLKPTQENLRLLKKVRNLISYGEIDKETLKELIEKRVRPLENRKQKIDAEKIVTEIEKKSLKELSLKPFFRLHPPRGGIDAKKHAGSGKGVLGENKKINELVRRML